MLCVDKNTNKKIKTLYHFSRPYLHFPGFFQVRKMAGQISRLFQEYKTLYKPWKWITIFSNFGAFISFDENAKCRWIFLELISWGQYSERKNCCSLLMPSIKHETRHFHSHWVMLFFFFDNVLIAVVAIVCKAL